MTQTKTDIQKEADRLLLALMHVHCRPGAKWDYDTCLEIAPLTLEIAELKRQKNAVIVAHSYVFPEIVYGVADVRGDSYALALEARNMNAKVIIFAGVVFMAETAKLVSPDAEVLVPDLGSGCSLADSLTGEELRALKAQHPGAAVVCYINSSAEVKAESDVVVTSGNVMDIIAKLPEKEILFVPDKLMAQNIRNEMQNRGVDKIIHHSEGTCIVHDHFDTKFISEERVRYPGLKVVSHPECTPEIAAASDFVGSTGLMMNYVKTNEAPGFMMLTECGLVSRLEAENPQKSFVSGCKLCPYMKLNSLEKIRQVLTAPRPEQSITVDATVAHKARQAIDRMFALTQN